MYKLLILFLKVRRGMLLKMATLIETFRAVRALESKYSSMFLFVITYRFLRLEWFAAVRAMKTFALVRIHVLFESSSTAQFYPTQVTEILRCPRFDVLISSPKCTFFATAELRPHVWP